MMHAPIVFMQSSNWEKVALPTLKHYLNLPNVAI